MDGNVHFSVAEANALLPWLEGELRRLQEQVALARAKHREKEMIKAVGYLADGALIMQKDYREAEEGLRATVKELDAGIERVQQTGVRIKDIDRGLVDFPAIVSGEEALLCWHVGEPRVAYYHDPASGYAGRKPLPAE